MENCLDFPQEPILARYLERFCNINKSCQLLQILARLSFSQDLARFTKMNFSQDLARFSKMLFSRDLARFSKM